MAASKRLVYIPSINENTWLLLTKRKQGTCLRDYSVSPASKDRGYTSDQIEEKLKLKGCYSESLPAFSSVPFGDEIFWREQISLRNKESGIADDSDNRRLQDRFKKECRDAKTPTSLAAVFQRWTDRFKCVLDKKQFNHWDNDGSKDKFSHKTGLGWTSQLLEASRTSGKACFIPTDNKITDISVVAMELGLGISSKCNHFRPNRTDFIKPDGLAITRAGYFTVIEVKGPDDEKSLDGPLLQATCGALAVLAKRGMLCRIARTQTSRRAAYTKAAIPLRGRTLGIHILTAASDDGRPRTPWGETIEQLCKSIIIAFPQLRYIAYSFVTEKQAKNLDQLPVNYLITENEVTPSG